MLGTRTAPSFALVQEGLAAAEACLREITPGQHPALTAAAERLLNAGGKRIRPTLVLLTAGIFPADPAHVVSLAAAVELLHTATLVHDDLIDGAGQRRGRPTLNAHWPADAAVLTGDYLFARAADLVTRTNNIPIIHLFTQTLMTIVNGEIKQKFSGPWNAGRDDYFERIYAKTAAMFVLSAEAAAVLGEADEDSVHALRSFGRQVGIAYQIVDDILDFVGSPEQIGKPTGSDLRQGLLTLPAIIHIENRPDDGDVLALLNGNLEDPDLIPRVVTAVRHSGAVNEALLEARQFVARGQLALRMLPDSEYTAALSEIAQYVVERDF